MTVEPFLLYDPESMVEILFESVVENINKAFVNDITNFRRHSDGTYESFLSGPGSRVVSFTIKTTNPSDTRRKLDYLSRSKRHMILILGNLDFASEVVIKGFEETETESIETPIEIEFTCFGEVGQVRVATDNDCTGGTITTDASALGGYCSILDSNGESRYFNVTVNPINMNEGDYLIIARAKATSNSTNDLTVRAYNKTDANAAITGSFAVGSTGFAYYIVAGSIDSSDLNDTIKVEAMKATATVNTIKVDMLAYVQYSQNAVITAPPASGSATVETFYPTADNRMKSSTATTVYATDIYLDIGASGSANLRDLLIFDLSSIPSTATISSAELSLWWYFPAGATRTNDTVVGVFRPRYTWNTSYVCWTNRVSGTAWTNAGGDWYDSTGASQGASPFASVTFAAGTVPDNAYHAFNVTTLVQAYVAGTYSNYGFLIKAITENLNYIAFYSKDYTGTTMRPKLVVTYTE